MNLFLLRMLDWIMHGAHLVVIVFNALGWVFESTRPVTLLVQSLTLGSWFGLGVWKGFGYCLFTDWHWRIKARLRQPPVPESYIKFLVDGIIRSDVDPALTERVTFAVFFIAIAVNVSLLALA